MAILLVQHILTFAGKSRFLNPDWFYGYYLSDFTLNIFGYDPFGNKTQISTNFCELICRPAAATILLTTIFHIAHLNRDTRNFSGLHQSWPGVTCLTSNSSKSEKGWFLSHQEDRFCDCFSPWSRLTKGLCKLLEQGASGFMRNFGAFFETMMHLRGAFLAQRRTSYDLHLLRGAPIQNVTKF